MLEEVSDSDSDNDSSSSDEESSDDDEDDSDEAEERGLDRLRDIAARPKITNKRLAGQPGLVGGVGIVEVEETPKMEE